MAKKQQIAASVLPKGFVNYGGGGSDGKPWEPEIGGELFGKCVGKKTIDAKTAGRQNAKKGETVTIVSVAEKETGEIFGIWQSHALTQWCAKVKAGDEVFLRLNAVKKSGKKRYKDITAAIKE
jgi:hypothetical protein